MDKNHKECSICFYTVCAHSASVLHARFSAQVDLIVRWVCGSESKCNQL